MGDRPPRRLTTAVVATTIGAVAATAGAATAAAPPDSSPPETMPPDTMPSDTVLTETVLTETVLTETVLTETVLTETVLTETVLTETYALVDGVFTAPDGSFSVAFAAVPVVAGDPPGFVAAAGEDAASVTTHPADAFGASALTTPDERAVLFLDAAGSQVELLANTPTRLGPYPAAYFIARLALAEGGPAMVYGAVVVRADDAVEHVIYTDLGGDDADAGRAFVESFTLHLPVATVTAPPTTVPTPSSVPTDPASTVPAASVAAPLAAPVGAVTSYDGSWWITFPAGAVPTLRAGSESGLAFAEYEAAVGDDGLRVRVTETPAGYERDVTSVPGFPGVVAESAPSDIVGAPAPSDVGGAPATRSTTEVDAGTLHAAVVDRGTQLITVTYLDAGEPSTDVAETFLDSFTPN